MSLPLKPTIFLALAFVLMAQISLPAADAPALPSRSVLFVGNSMIGNTVKHMRELTKAAGCDWRIEAVLKGGARLESFAGDKKFDAFGKIDAGGWTDVVFVQGTKYWFNGKPGDAVNIHLTDEERIKDAEVTLAAALDFHRHITAVGARTVLYMGYPHMGAQERTPAAYRPLEAIHWTMKDRLDAAIIGGKNHPALLVPNGPLWIRGAEHFGEQVWYKNDPHGNEIALYANACLFFACIEGRDPRPIAYNGGLPAEHARWIWEQAWKLSQTYKRP